MSSKVKVYSKKKCVQCSATTRMLKDLNINFEYIDLDETPERMEEILSLGYRSVPIVVIDENNHFSGFQPGRLKTL